MRVRNRCNGSALKYVGKFPSLKLRRTVLWDSQIKRDFIFLLEFAPDIVWYEERASQMSDLLKGLTGSDVPDFLVLRKEKKQAIKIIDL